MVQQDLLRQRNTALVVIYLASHPKAQVREVEAATGIPFSAADRKLKELVKEGWVLAEEVEKKSVGKPPKLYSLIWEPIYAEFDKFVLPAFNERKKKDNHLLFREYIASTNYTRTLEELFLALSVAFLDIGEVYSYPAFDRWLKEVEKSEAPEQLKKAISATYLQHRARTFLTRHYIKNKGTNPQ